MEVEVNANSSNWFSVLHHLLSYVECRVFSLSSGRGFVSQHERVEREAGERGMYEILDHTRGKQTAAFRAHCRSRRRHVKTRSKGLPRRRASIWICRSKPELGERLHATARLRTLEAKAMPCLFFFYVYSRASPACS